MSTKQKGKQEDPLEDFKFLANNFKDGEYLEPSDELEEEVEEEIKEEEEQKQLEDDSNIDNDKKVDSEEENSDDSKESDNTEEEESEENEQKFIPIIKYFSEKGILEEVEEIEDSEEGFEKTIEETVKKRSSKLLDEELSYLGEDGKKLLEFVKQGGDPKQFVQLYYNPITWADYEPDGIDAYKFAIRQSLQLDGDYTPEEIEETLTEWEDLGENTLKKHGEKHLNKLRKIEQDQKEYLIKSQKEQELKKIKDREDYWNNFKDNLDKKEDIKGFKLSNKDKNDLWDFMTKVDKKTGKTGYQSALDTDSSLMLAYFAMKGFDINKLEKQVKSKVVSNLGERLKNINKSDSRSKLKTGQTEDFSDERNKTNPFSGFKKMI